MRSRLASLRKGSIAQSPFNKSVCLLLKIKSTFSLSSPSPVASFGHPKKIKSQLSVKSGKHPRHRKGTSRITSVFLHWAASQKTSVRQVNKLLEKLLLYIAIYFVVAYRFSSMNSLLPNTYDIILKWFSSFVNFKCRQRTAIFHPFTNNFLNNNNNCFYVTTLKNYWFYT